MRRRNVCNGVELREEEDYVKRTECGGLSEEEDRVRRCRLSEKEED